MIHDLDLQTVQSRRYLTASLKSVVSDVNIVHIQCNNDLTEILKEAQHEGKGQMQDIKGYQGSDRC